MSQSTHTPSQIVMGYLAAGMLAAETDGTVADTERALVLAQVRPVAQASGLQVTDAELLAFMQQVSASLRTHGTASTFQSVAALLPEGAHRENALRIAAAVYLVDGEVPALEGKMYLELAHAFGISELRAEDLWEEVLTQREGPLPQ